jgi:hypothetical protein
MKHGARGWSSRLIGTRPTGAPLLLDLKYSNTKLIGVDSLKVRVLLGLLSLAAVQPFAFGETPVIAPEVIVQNYCAAAQEQMQTLKAASMDMEIDASLPKMKKQGKLQALRRISSLGRITYEKLRFEGDNSVKKEVISRYLSSEAEAQRGPAASVAVVPANYKFSYKGHGELEGRDVHIFDVTPRKKREGLFKGTVWIDSATYLRVQESGYFVKNQSFMVKKIAFVRKYQIRDGIAIPEQVQSVADMHLFGKVEMTIGFSNFSVDDSSINATDGPDHQ